MTDLSRRTLWTSMAALWLGLGAGTARAGAPDNETEVLLSLLDDRQNAAAIGSAWLDQDGEKPRAPGALVASLTETLRQQGWNGGTDREALRGKLAAAVQADYRAGAVVTVEGWQIAKTQAELCALAYLAPEGYL